MPSLSDESDESFSLKKGVHSDCLSFIVNKNFSLLKPYGARSKSRATRYLPSRKTQSGAVGRKLGSEGDRLVTSGHTEIQIYRLNKASPSSNKLPLSAFS
jgi:hypothetical protein